MGYKSQAVGTVPVTFVSTPEHSRTRPTGIKIYNPDSAERIVTGTDVFTPDESEGEDSPSEETKQFLKVSVGSALTADIPRTELEDCKLLGTVKFAADDISVDSPVVSLFYDVA